MALVKDRMDAAMRSLLTGKASEREVSQAVEQAFREGMPLLVKGDAQAALDKLAPLARYASLETFPSFRVQLLQAQAYRALGDKDRHAVHQVQAMQLAQLRERGRSAEAPLQLQHLMQMGDLILIGGGKAKDTRFETQPDGRRLLVVEFDQPLDGEAKRYLQLPEAALRSSQVSRYAPLPQDKMNDEMRGAITEARAVLERLLTDKALKFHELELALKEAIEAADGLTAKQQNSEALKALQALSRLRALDEIPHVPLLSRLSYLHGQLGNRAEQQRLRLKLFGLQQAIGATGDGLSFETAVEVPFIVLEYDWLADKKLRSERQALVHQGEKSYDVMDVVDEQGVKSKRYFDVSRMFALRAAGLASKP